MFFLLLQRSKQCIDSFLTRLGVRRSSGEALPTLLEVGAINCQLVTNKWLKVDAIDINSRHPKIQQINFFVDFHHCTSIAIFDFEPLYLIVTMR